MLCCYTCYILNMDQLRKQTQNDRFHMNWPIGDK
jgi:hypothetical protein